MRMMMKMETLVSVTELDLTQVMWYIFPFIT